MRRFGRRATAKAEPAPVDNSPVVLRAPDQPKASHTREVDGVPCLQYTTAVYGGDTPNPTVVVEVTHAAGPGILPEFQLRTFSELARDCGEATVILRHDVVRGEDVWHAIEFHKRLNGYGMQIGTRTVNDRLQNYHVRALLG